MSNPLEEFLGMQEKQASFWSNFGKAVAGGAAAAVGATGVAAAGMGLSRAFGAAAERADKARDYKAMMAAHPSLRKEPAGQVQMVYNSLRNMAPDMANDPLVAGSFVRNTMSMAGPEGPDVAPSTAKMLADTQKSISTHRKPGALLSQYMGAANPNMMMWDKPRRK
jgi:hypothetical protein